MPEPTLSDVKVTEADCRQRTGEIIAIQKQTLKAVTGHIAFHKGAESAKSQGMSRLGSYAKVIGLVLSIVVLLGTLVWNTATSLQAAEVAQMAAKKVNGE